MVYFTSETLRVMSAATAAEKRYKGPMEEARAPQYEERLRRFGYEAQPYTIISGEYRDRRFEKEDVENCAENCEGGLEALIDVARVEVDTDEC